MVTSLLQMGANYFAGKYNEQKERERLKRNELLLNREELDLKSLFDRDYYRDFMDRSETQGLLRNLSNNLAEEGEIARNTAVVTGATPEVSALQQKNASQAMATAISGIASQADGFRDKARDVYMNGRQNVINKRYDANTNSGNLYGANKNNYYGESMLGIPKLFDSFFDIYKA